MNQSRRTRLIWFAFGAAITTALAVTAHIYTVMHRPAGLSLVVTDRALTPSELAEPANTDEKSAPTSARAVYNCGLRKFQIDISGVDHIPNRTTVHIAESETRELNCLLRVAMEENISMRLEVDSD